MRRGAFTNVQRYTFFAELLTFTHFFTLRKIRKPVLRKRNTGCGRRTAGTTGILHGGRQPASTAWKCPKEPSLGASKPCPFAHCPEPSARSPKPFARRPEPFARRPRPSARSPFPLRAALFPSRAAEPLCAPPEAFLTPPYSFRMPPETLRAPPGTAVQPSSHFCANPTLQRPSATWMHSGTWAGTAGRPRRMCKG